MKRCKSLSRNDFLSKRRSGGIHRNPAPMGPFFGPFSRVRPLPDCCWRRKAEVASSQFVMQVQELGHDAIRHGRPARGSHRQGLEPPRHVGLVPGRHRPRGRGWHFRYSWLSQRKRMSFSRSRTSLSRDRAAGQFVGSHVGFLAAGQQGALQKQGLLQHAGERDLRSLAPRQDVLIGLVA